MGTCPSPVLQDLAADRRMVQVSWVKPTFSGATTDQSNYKPGAVFGRGTYPIAYLANDDNKNFVKCDFNVYVRGET